MKKLFVFLALCLLLAVTTHAKDISLSWDASPSSNVTGYKIYYQGENSTAPLTGSDAVEGESPVDVGLEMSKTLTGLDDSKQYSFVVTAYNGHGESAYSNIVSEDCENDPVTGVNECAPTGAVLRLESVSKTTTTTEITTTTAVSVE